MFLFAVCVRDATGAMVISIVGDPGDGIVEVTGLAGSLDKPAGRTGTGGG